MGQCTSLAFCSNKHSIKVEFKIVPPYEPQSYFYEERDEKA